MAGYIFLFGLYTNIAFIAGAATFPAVSALPGFLLLLPYYTAQFTWKRLIGIFSLPIIAALFSIFVPNEAGFFEKHLIACGQFLYSLGLGLMLFFHVRSYSRDALARFLVIAIPIYMALLAVEVLTPFKSVVIAYMDVYRGGYDYTILNRDVGIAGGHRPKFFTSETSYVSMTLTFAIGLYAWAAKGNSKYVKALGFFVAGLIIVRSPILLATPLLIAAVYMSDALNDQKLFNFTVVSAPFALVVAIGLFSLVLNVAQPLFEARLKGIQSGRDYSTTYRTYGSYAAGIAVANEYPLFGVGIGTHDTAAPIVQSVFAANGVPIAAVARDWRNSLANAFAYALIIFGYMGTIVLLGLSFWLITRLGAPLSLPFLAMFTVLALTFGAVYTPKFVCHTMLFAAFSATLSKSSSASRRQPG